MRILVAYDGSVCGDGALFELSSAGLPPDAEVLVLTAAPPRESLPDAVILAKRAARYLAGRFPGWIIRSEARPNRAAEAILARSRAWKADLIVMGSHGRSGPTRLIVGSVSQKVAWHSRVPVRIARARIGADPAAPRVLVAIDGSPGSLAAVDAVASRIWPADTLIRLIAVMDPKEDGPGSAEGAGSGCLAPGTRTRIGRLLDRASAKLSGKGLKVTLEVRLGEPRHLLLQEARTWPAHCVFLGSCGRTSFRGFLIGSVASAMALHAPCSVEVVRPAGKASRRGSQGRTNSARNRRVRPDPKSKSIRHR
ncbi:MAG: Universal stress protein UspA-like nucleotide-binding protein [Fibrobacteres bacterium]|nr:Universal stress protein UspA-like nucleotide-binding protein [Fibrobacterota bacterium]